MGMYPLAQYPADSFLWEFMAYCAGTGGSILIIGSAAGVAAMGIEKIQFIWYMRRIAWLARSAILPAPRFMLCSIGYFRRDGGMFEGLSNIQKTVIVAILVLLAAFDRLGCLDGNNYESPGRDRWAKRERSNSAIPLLPGRRSQQRRRQRNELRSFKLVTFE